MPQVTYKDLGIAVVDDDGVYRGFVSALLSKNSDFAIFEASSGDELCEILDGQTIDCILLDYNLGIESGFAIRERLIARYPLVPPIVMLTGDGRESTVIKALRIGINDYLAKRDLRADALLSAINRVVEEDRKERLARAEHQRLARVAGLDLVTGLLGKSNLDDRLAQLAALGARSRAAYGLILVQMVELEHIAGTFGLKVGDQALRLFGERLQAAARSSDICGRYSDGTFLVIADIGNDSSQLEAVCERLADQVSFRMNLDAVSFELSAHIGAARCSQIERSEVVSGADLLQLAHNALVASKTETLRFGIAEVRSFDVPSVQAPTEGTGNQGVSRPAADALRTSDRRSVPRQRVFKRGQITVPSAGTTVDCTVRNLSVYGAGLRIDAIFSVPAEFELLIAGEGIKRSVRVRWEIGHDLGVEFIGGPAHPVSDRS